MMSVLNPIDQAFEDAITLITGHAYDDETPTAELLPKLAWKAFVFGLDIGMTSPDSKLTDPTGAAMLELESNLGGFHDAFLAMECQEALAQAARNGNVTKLAAAIQLHVSRYLDDRSLDIEQVESHRMEHAVGLTTFCLCSSLRIVKLDTELAEIYWHEVATTRGDRIAVETDQSEEPPSG